jgi:hypothetical protein
VACTPRYPYGKCQIKSKAAKPSIFVQHSAFLPFWVKTVPIHKWPICPISALCEKFYPLHYNHMPVVKFFESLDLDPICLFLDESWMAKIGLFAFHIRFDMVFRQVKNIG